MPQKRNKFLTVVFSCLPGAGHMFMGFMKMGLSLMIPFFLIIFLSSWLDLGPLMYIIPILCFYSFFDAINKCFSSDEIFSQFEDHYLLSADRILESRYLKGKGRLFIGILILLLGLYMLYKTGVDSLSYYISAEVLNTIIRVADFIPKIAVSLIIIIAGIYLIVGKKRSVDKDV
ncbi:putative membrane protein [[Clostridium] cellulosi]|jgi:hypothetical protein|uniref:Putative membrane protein n=1 Tax=[Clostridium] cellulosi TaxID=29343 RepID=A0A078KLQ6_9FIRM|nr:MAG: hypothetical protein DIU81_01640 [[Clostridium] cellulosi]CDZ23402.1 putative membrane protein [[Clostridium] cellulosi]